MNVLFYPYKGKSSWIIRWENGFIGKNKNDNEGIARGGGGLHNSVYAPSVEEDCYPCVWGPAAANIACYGNLVHE